MKLRHFGLLFGLTAAAGLALFGDKTPHSAIAEPTVRSGPPATTPATNTSSLPSTNKAADKLITDPTIPALLPREKLIGNAQVADGGLFSSQTWAPPPPKPPPPPPPPPPKAPPLPFSFLGKQMVGNVIEVFIANGNEVYVVREQALVEEKYRVDKIKPPLLTFTYLPLNQVQTLAIGEFD